MATLTARRIAERCAADGEFRLAARHWDGALSIGLGDERFQFQLANGQLTAEAGAPDLTISAPESVWQHILSPVPPPFFNDIMPARAFGLSLAGDLEMFAQYYPAIRRMVDIMREEANA